MEVNWGLFTALGVAWRVLRDQILSIAVLGAVFLVVGARASQMLTQATITQPWLRKRPGSSFRSQ